MAFFGHDSPDNRALIEEKLKQAFDMFNLCLSRGYLEPEQEFNTIYMVEMLALYLGNAKKAGQMMEIVNRLKQKNDKALKDLDSQLREIYRNSGPENEKLKKDQI